MDFIKEHLSKLSPRDRMLLFVLALFIPLAGFYQFYFDPLYSQDIKLAKAMSDQKANLRKIAMKLRERSSWELDKEKYLAEIKAVSGSILMPASDKDISEVVKALMDASKESHLDVTNLRPLKRTLEDGVTPVVDTFTLEGFTRSKDFISFLDTLWGMKIQEINLNKAGEKKKKPIRFYIKMSLFSPEDIEVTKSEESAKVSLASFSLPHDPFYPRKKIVKPKPRKIIKKPERVKAPPPPPPPPRINLSGARLEGISSRGDVFMAIVVEENKKELLFLSPGDSFRNYEVDVVDAQGITFSYKEGVTGRLKLPREKVNFTGMQVLDKGVSPGFMGTSSYQGTSSGPGQITERNIPEASKRGKLGFRMKTVTPMLARKKKLEINKGLLVTRVSANNAALMAGDVIISMNGIKVKTRFNAIKVLKGIKAGDKVDLEIVRGDETMTVSMEAQ